jgi:hypothetical protein
LSSHKDKITIQEVLTPARPVPPVFFPAFRKTNIRKPSLAAVPILFRETAFQVFQLREKEGDVLLDDAPQDVVVNAEVGMD